MNARKQAGEINTLVVSLVLVSVLLIGAVAFGAWAFNSRQDYKNHADQKAAAAVTVANAKLKTKLDQQYAEEAKQPYTVYKTDQSLGSVRVTYPKTWSAYVSSTPSGSDTLLDAYFNPDFVPGVNDQAGQAYALRLSIVPQAYSAVVQQINQQANNQPLTSKPYQFPQVPGVVGIEFSGSIEQGKTGTMVVVPLRNNTLEVWTEGGKFDADFNKVILKNFTFSP